MLEFLRSLPPIIVPIFVIATMLNVGLTQKLPDILGYLREWPFVLKMLLANFVLVPLVMIALLRFMAFPPGLEAGLLIFALCAGAPFLIKLTQLSGHNLALGAAVMLLLIVVTVVYLPLVLPLLLEGVTVDAWAVARSLLVQMIVPLIVGLGLVQFLPGLARAVQPWAGRVGEVFLYLVLGVTLIGYLGDMLGLVGTGAIFVALAFILAAFGIGYFMGWGNDELEDIGGLGTAQRNTAAGLLIATQNFTDPDVLVIMTVANALGLMLLLFVARRLSRDNRVRPDGI